MDYNWQQPDWANFRYQTASLEADLFAFADKAGRVSGLLQALPEDGRGQTVVDFMIAEAMNTSAIEGEYLSRADVKSSIRNAMGLNAPAERVKDATSKGAAELMVAVRESWQDNLTQKALFEWHRILFQGTQNLRTGRWRAHSEPMQVISGPIGSPMVHFQAPPSAQVPGEMAAYIRWFNRSRDIIALAPVRAGLAHLYFESIHPFEDGNGRIGRALAEKALSQGLGRPVLMSLSQTIEANKRAYYAALETAQRSNEVTEWLGYFVGVVLQAQADAEQKIEFVLRKARFFDQFTDQLSGRQLKVVRRMLDEGADGFVGGINASKYASLTRVSKATATRDLQDLSEKGVLLSIGGGRSTRYELSL